MEAATPKRRMSADARREELVRIATEHFAKTGYAGTSTEAIARDAGISQPYLFRLFRTKKELFLAVCGENSRIIIETFRKAAEGAPVEDRLEHMGKAYTELLHDQTHLRAQHQMYAAAGADHEIQAAVRSGYGSVVAEVRRLSQAPNEAVWDFMAKGMLLNVLAALDLHELADIDKFC